MAHTPEDIIEAIVDELVIGDLAADVPGVEVTRLDAETVVVDQGPRDGSGSP